MTRQKHRKLARRSKRKPQLWDLPEYRPRLERLESRLAPATGMTIFWDGGGDATSWHDPRNWLGDILPSTGDDVVIVDVPQTTIVQFTPSAGSARLNSFTTSESLRITGGSLTIDADSAANSSFEQSGGVFGGSGTLTVQGNYTWTGGTLSGPGVSEARSNLTLAGTTKTLTGRTLRIAGNATWTAGDFAVGPNALLHNVGLFEIETSADLFSTSGGTATVLNEGTIRKSDNSLTYFQRPLNNAGIIEINTGQLEILGGGTSTGDWIIAEGATLFSRSNYTLAEGSGIAGEGAFELASGTLSIDGDVTVSSVLHQTGGTLGGAATLTLDNHFIWTGGTQSGGGFTRIAATASMAGGTKTLSGRTLLNAGTISWTAGDLAVGPNALLHNVGLFEIETSADLFSTSGGTATVLNEGTIRKSDNSLTYFQRPLNNAGVFEVNAGQVEILSGGTSTGDWVIADGANLFSRSNYTLAEGSGIAGEGTFELSSGILSVDSDVLISSEFHQTGGTLGGTATLTLDDNFLWTGGIQSGGGVTEIVGAATLAGGTKTLSGRTLLNDGTITWTLGDLAVGPGALLHNVGLFEIETSADLFSTSGGTATVLNEGTIRKSDDSLTYFQRPLNNAGIIEINAGELDLRSGLTNYDSATQTLTGGTFILARMLRLENITLRNLNAEVSLMGTAGSLVSSSGLDLLAGINTIAASGSLRLEEGAALTLSGSLRQSGRVFVGLDSELIVNGALQQSTTSDLRVFLSDNAATASGAVAVSGSTTLGGRLELTYDPSFSPADGQMFDVLIANEIEGDFETKAGLLLPDGRLLQLQTLQDRVSLVVESATSDLSSTLSGGLANLWSALEDWLASFDMQPLSIELPVITSDLSSLFALPNAVGPEDLPTLSKGMANNAIVTAMESAGFLVEHIAGGADGIPSSPEGERIRVHYQRTLADLTGNPELSNATVLESLAGIGDDAQITSNLEVLGELTLHLIFGIDGDGFYVDGESHVDLQTVASGQVALAGTFAGIPNATLTGNADADLLVTLMIGAMGQRLRTQELLTNPFAESQRPVSGTASIDLTAAIGNLEFQWNTNWTISTIGNGVVTSSPTSAFSGNLNVPGLVDSSTGNAVEARLELTGSQVGQQWILAGNASGSIDLSWFGIELESLDFTVLIDANSLVGDGSAQLRFVSPGGSEVLVDLELTAANGALGASGNVLVPGNLGLAGILPLNIDRIDFVFDASANHADFVIDVAGELLLQEIQSLGQLPFLPYARINGETYTPNDNIPISLRINSQSLREGRFSPFETGPIVFGFTGLSVSDAVIDGEIELGSYVGGSFNADVSGFVNVVSSSLGSLLVDVTGTLSIYADGISNLVLTGTAFVPIGGGGDVIVEGAQVDFGLSIVATPTPESPFLTFEVTPTLSSIAVEQLTVQVGDVLLLTANDINVGGGGSGGPIAVLNSVRVDFLTLPDLGPGSLDGVFLYEDRIEIGSGSIIVSGSIGNSPRLLTVDTLTLGFENLAVELATGIILPMLNPNTGQSELGRLTLSSNSATILPDVGTSGFATLQGLEGSLDFAGNLLVDVDSFTATIDGVLHLEGLLGQVQFGPTVSATTPLFTVDTATITVDALEGVEFQIDDFFIGQGGQIGLSQALAVLDESNVLKTAIGDLLPFSIEQALLRFPIPGDFNSFEILVGGAFDFTGYDLPFTPIVEVVSPEIGLDSEVVFGLHVDSLRDLQIEPTAISSITLGFDDLIIGEVVLGATITLGGFQNGERVGAIEGSLRVEGGLGEISDPDFGSTSLSLDGLEIDLTGNWKTAAQNNGVAELFLEVDAFINVKFALADIVELAGVGFNFDLTLTNPADQLNPQVDFNFNQLSVGEMRVRFGDVLVLSAIGGTLNFNDPNNPGAIPEEIVSFQDVSFDFPSIEGLRGSLENLVIGSDFLPRLPGLVVQLDVPEFLQDTFEWLPITVDSLGIGFHEDLFSTNEQGQVIGIDDPTAFSIFFSGGVTPITLGEGPDAFTIQPLAIEVQNVELDVQALIDRRFPIKSIEGLTIGIETVRIGELLEIGGGVSFGTIFVDHDNAPDTPDISVLYGRLFGEFAIEGIGGQAELVLTTYGPVAASLQVPLAIVLGQSGIMITGVSGTIQFGLEPLPDISHPSQLAGDEFQNPLNVDFSDPETVRRYITPAVQKQQFTLQQSAILAIAGSISHVAVAGAISGQVTLAANLGLQGNNAGLNLMGFGDVKILGLPIAGLRLLVNLTDPVNPIFAGIFQTPPPENPLGFLIPARADFGLLLNTKGFALAGAVGISAFLEKLAIGAAEQAFESAGPLFDLTLDRIANHLNERPDSKLAELLADESSTGNLWDATTLLAALRNVIPTTSDLVALAESVANGEDNAATILQRVLDVATAFTNEIFVGIGKVLEDLQSNYSGDISAIRLVAGLDAVAAAEGMPDAVIAQFSQVTGSIHPDLARDALLSFVRVLREAVLGAGQQVGELVQNDLLFDPVLIMSGGLRALIAGVPLGDPAVETELVLSKRGLAFGGTFSQTEAMFTVLNAATALVASSLPLPFSDEVSYQAQLPLSEDAIVGMLNGQLPTISPLSPDWGIFYTAAQTIFDFQYINVVGMIFPPLASGLLQANVQKVFEPSASHPDAVPDTDPSFILDGSKFQVTSAEAYDHLFQYGGILTQAGLQIPAVISDPFKVAANLPATPPDNIFGIPGFLEQILNAVGEIQEVAKIQTYLPSFLTILDFNFEDHNVEFPDPNDPSAVARILAKAGLTQESVDALFQASFIEGIYTGKVLGIDLASARIRASSDELIISGAIPWLGGLDVNFRLIGRDEATRTIPLVINGEAVLDENGDPVLIDQPFPAVAAEIAVRTNKDVDGLSDWDRILQSWGFDVGPSSVFRTPGRTATTFRAVSPGYDPLSADPLYSLGGIEILADLDIPGFIDTGRFRFQVTPPSEGSQIPDVVATASVERVTIPGLSNANGLIDLSNFEVTVSESEGAVGLGLTGDVQLFGPEGLSLRADGQLAVSQQGIAGSIRLAQRVDYTDPDLGLRIRGDVYLDFNSSAQTLSSIEPGGRIRVVGSLESRGFHIGNGEFSISVDGSSLRIDANGTVAFLGQTFTLADGSFLHLSTEGLSGSVQLSELSVTFPGSLLNPLTQTWTIQGSLGLSFAPGTASFTVEGSTSVPGILNNVDVEGAFASNGTGELALDVDIVPLGGPSTVVSLEGDFSLVSQIQGFLGNQGLVMTLHSENASLVVDGFATIAVDSLSVSSTGNLSATLGALSVTLPPPPGVSPLLPRMTFAATGGSVSFTPQSGLTVNLSNPSATIPGFAIPISWNTSLSFSSDGLFSKELPGNLDIGVFYVEGELAFERVGNQYQIAIRAPAGSNNSAKLGVEGLFNVNIEEFNINSDGTFLVSASGDRFGNDVVSIEAPSIVIRKTGASLSTFRVDLEGGKLDLSLGNLVDLPTTRFDSNGLARRVLSGGLTSTTFLFAGMSLGSAMTLPGNPQFGMEIENGIWNVDLKQSTTIQILGIAVSLNGLHVDSTGGFNASVTGALKLVDYQLASGTFAITKVGSELTLTIPSSSPVIANLGFTTISIHGIVKANGDFDVSGTKNLSLTVFSGTASFQYRRISGEIFATFQVSDAFLKFPLNKQVSVGTVSFFFGNPTFVAAGNVTSPIVEFGSSLATTAASAFSVQLYEGGSSISLNSPVSASFLGNSVSLTELYRDSTGAFQMTLSGTMTLSGVQVFSGNMAVSIVGSNYQVSLTDGSLALGFETVTLSGYLRSSGVYNLGGSTSVDLSNSKRTINGTISATVASSSGFSAAFNGFISAFGFEILRTSFDVSRVGTSSTYQIGVPTTTIDLEFLESSISGSLQSSGDFYLSGSSTLEVGAPDNSPNSIDENNSISGTLSLTLGRDEGFVGSFSGTGKLLGVSLLNITGSLTKNGCLAVTGSAGGISYTQKFALGPNACTGLFIYGTVMDGLLAGAQVFFDANRNGVWDFLDLNANGVQDDDEPDEPGGVTDYGGRFILGIPAVFDRNDDGLYDLDEGVLTVTGGIDISTGLPLSTPLFAPANEGLAVISPITTLVVAVTTVGDLSPTQAASLVRDRLSLGDIDLFAFDPIAAAVRGEVDATEVYAYQVILQNMAVQLGSLMTSISTVDLARASGAVYSSIATQMFGSTTTFSPVDESWVSDLAVRAKASLGLSVSADLLNSVVSAITAGNSLVLSRTDAAPLDELSAISRVQWVSQSTVVNAMPSLVNGSISQQEFAAEFTGERLLEQVLTAESGSIVPPEIYVENAEVWEGDSGVSNLEFVIRLSESQDHEVLIRYQLADGSAFESSGDYLGQSGMLVFFPGEVEKRIEVGVLGDTLIGPDETMTLYLFGPDGAVIGKAAATGTILSDDLVDVGLQIDAPSTTVRNQPTRVDVAIMSDGYQMSDFMGVLFDWNNDGQFDAYSSVALTTAVETTKLTSLGPQEIRIGLLSAEGSLIAVATHTIQVLPYALLTNEDSGLVDLIWGGTGENDAIIVSSEQANSFAIRHQTALDNEQVMVFDGVTGQVQVFAGLGNDTINASGVHDRPLILDGGNGDDTIYGGTDNDVINADGAEGRGNDYVGGGNGNDVINGDGAEGLFQRAGDDMLDGGDGDDLLFADGPEGSGADYLIGGDGDDIAFGGGGSDQIEGGNGRDLLIGGIGADSINGGDGSDLILAAVSHYAHPQPLRQIHAEWTSSRSFADRVANISGIADSGRENGDSFFIPGSTALNDRDVDLVLGGSDEDWLLSDATLDVLEDFDPILDLVTEL